MMKAGTSASSISTSAGFQAFSLLPGESLREAPKERVARKFLEDRPFHPLPDDPAHPRPDGDADQETRDQHDSEREEAFRWQPGREEVAQRAHQGGHRLHALEQSQHRKVDRHHDEQPADQHVGQELARKLHEALPMAQVVRRPSAEASRAPSSRT
jgi:hypothetical protein